MEKKLTVLFVIILLLFLFAQNVSAEKSAGSSAALLATNNNTYNTNKADELAFIAKKKAIRKVLEKYKSPLIGQEDSFITACKTYELDCYLLPSIMGIESAFGKMLIPGTYNGYGWGRGLIYFKDWHDANMTVAKGLRENYINKGATSVEQIGRIYCEGNTWAGKVRFFIRQFEAAEQELNFNPDSVQL